MIMIYRNGSMEERTIRVAGMPCRNEKILYLCSAFETQVQDIEY